MKKRWESPLVPTAQPTPTPPSTGIAPFELSKLRALKIADRVLASSHGALHRPVAPSHSAVAPLIAPRGAATKFLHHLSEPDLFRNADTCSTATTTAASSFEFRSFAASIHAGDDLDDEPENHNKTNQEEPTKEKNVVNKQKVTTCDEDIEDMANREIVKRLRQKFDNYEHSNGVDKPFVKVRLDFRKFYYVLID